MGSGQCSCSEVRRHDDLQTIRHPVLGESDSEPEAEHHQEDVAVDSDSEHDHQEYKKGIEALLRSTASEMKRGKTLVMKEAIRTAKKAGVKASRIREAEHALNEHKKQQRREEVEEEVEKFYETSKAKESKGVKQMLRVAEAAECRKEVLDRLQDSLALLVITRPLEEEEVDKSRTYLRQSCRAFVEAAIAGGRSAIRLDLDDGCKVLANMTLDPPMQHLIVQLDCVDPESKKFIPVSTLVATPAASDDFVIGRKEFKALEEVDVECALALRYEANGRRGVLCFIEPTPLRRDRLMEALTILRIACH